jgi:hypothetical protein
MQPERARVIACEIICFYNNAKTIVNKSLTVNVQAYCSRLEVDRAQFSYAMGDCLPMRAQVSKALRKPNNVSLPNTASGE